MKEKLILFIQEQEKIKDGLINKKPITSEDAQVVLMLESIIFELKRIVK